MSPSLLEHPLALGIGAPLLIVFGESFWAHVRDRRRLRMVLQRIALPQMAVLLTVYEGVVVVLLVAQPCIGAALAAAFIGIATWRIARAHRIAPVSDCGCGMRTAPVSRGFFVRNFALLGLCVVLALSVMG